MEQQHNGLRLLSFEEAVAQLDITGDAFINGEYHRFYESCYMEKISPIQSAPIKPIGRSGQQEVDLAVAAAKAAFNDGQWSKKPPAEKKEILLNLAKRMEEERYSLALMDTIETGRSLSNYYFDSIPKAIEVVRYFSEAIDKLYDKAIPQRGSQSGLVIHQPLGVVGAIIPWNDPLVVAMWKIAPALAMGNSIVVKPAEQATYSILRVAELAIEVGIPPGVLNIVPGLGEEAGRCLALHQDVAAIFFTGSSQTGKKILQYAGQSNMKRVSLECGGKSPYLVTKKCTRIKEAASVLAENMFYNQGQICSAPSRAIVDWQIMDQFMGHLVDELDKYAPGNPLNPANRVGCMVSKEQKERVDHYIDKGLQCAEKTWSASPKNDMPNNAIYQVPRVFLLRDYECEIWREEIFGPVLTVTGSDSLEESIKLANDSKYGLAAAIWTDDLSEAYYAINGIEAGLVHVNSYGDDDNSAPFGGIKESGIGKDKSMHAFEEYSYLKTVWINQGKV